MAIWLKNIFSLVVIVGLLCGCAVSHEQKLYDLQERAVIECTRCEDCKSCVEAKAELDKALNNGGR